jgi:hypothetical protein
MSKPDAGNDSVPAFIETVERFLSVIDGLDYLSAIELLRHMDELIPLLYGHAQQLHGLDDADDHGELAMHIIFSPENRSERYGQLRTRIEAKLGRQDLFRTVHDPFVENEKTIDVTLSDVLAELYIYMKSVLDAYRRVADQDRRVVLSRVIPAAGLYWGHDAVEAILAVHWLVHHHYDDIGDEFFLYGDSDEEPSP